MKPQQGNRTGLFVLLHIFEEVINMKNNRMIKEKCNSAFVLKKVSTSENGRYGCLRPGSVPAISFMNGA